ncbi:hypothetical protein [Ekhidna sp.]|jgi:hypothetical protein|uniref:hypothetical protein n=1 Tax=Ekhidna sp. TaxID=2608089 RepID=UPI0032F03A02
MSENTENNTFEHAEEPGAVKVPSPKKSSDSEERSSDQVGDDRGGSGRNNPAAPSSPPYPPKMKVGQPATFRLRAKDIKNLEKLFRHHRKRKVSDKLEPTKKRQMKMSDMLSYCIEQTRKSECW